MGDPGQVPGGAEGSESQIAPRHDGTAHDRYVIMQRQRLHWQGTYVPLLLRQSESRLSGGFLWGAACNRDSRTYHVACVGDGLR